MGWMMLVTLGVLARRKAVVALMALLFVTAIPQRAMAADEFGEQTPWTSKAYSFDYSMTQFDSQAIQSVFGTEEMYPGLNLGASFQVFRVLEFSSGLGLWIGTHANQSLAMEQPTWIVSDCQHSNR